MAEAGKKYIPKKVEAKWQEKWLAEKAFRASDDSPKPKYYQLETFPYPSAAGLHVGHPKGYIAEDVHARYMRMGGDSKKPGGVGDEREVLYTMGWDAFGLPTENYAIKMGRSPQEVAKENTDNFRRQVQMFGFSYDWDREINTSSPEYYKWTQWIFLQLYKRGLAYRADAKVNWCPNDQTVLANEQVVDGKCERCGHVIEERKMEQWFLRITKYAERLLSGLKGLDWPAATIKRQEDWVGKSEGAEISFALDFKKNPADNDRRGPDGARAALAVFTTRPDTLFGATYLVLAPEHPWVTLAIDDNHDVLLNKDEVKKYVEAASHKTDLMRMEAAKEKTGVELKGAKAVNPATEEEIPIWVADYVLGSYGTGAIMAVPAHDERDFEFAKKFGLPMRKVVEPPSLRTAPEAAASMGISHGDLRVESNLYSGNGTLLNSGKFDGMESEQAKAAIVKEISGKMKTQYKLRDWSVSRQRYWGVPIPMIHCEECKKKGVNDGMVPVPEDELPVLLPELENFRPKGLPPLAGSKEFMNVKCPQCGSAAERDPETLDTFVDSSWYYLRYTDPKNDREIFSKEKAKHWLPVDLYVIGAEHTVLHLLYSRFITKFLHDEGYIDFEEPFLKLRHQGLIRGADGQKMSKSRGNVVNPDELVEEFGADTVRMYEMFMGPFEDGAPWDPKSILGVDRFLGRVWKYGEKAIAAGGADRGSANRDADDGGTNKSARALLNKTVKKVGEDIEGFKFNTGISALMILMNELEASVALSRSDLESFIKILNPFAPHMAQELWEMAGNKTLLDFEKWPGYDEKLMKGDKIKIVLQVEGRVRDVVLMQASATEAEVKELALGNAKVAAALGGKEPRKFIYVDKKLLNIII